MPYELIDTAIIVILSTICIVGGVYAIANKEEY